MPSSATVLDKPSAPAELIGGSFRDPTGRVFLQDGNVLRGLTQRGYADFRALARTSFYADALSQGRIVGTEEMPESLDGFAATLRHERLAIISYPYEWPFSMLQDAALLTLDLTASALGSGLATKDATPYNVQFRGTEPVFIDVGSFEPFRPGEPWYGYLQFCQLFLYPLLLQAHKNLDVRAWLRGSVDGIRPSEAARIFSSSDWRRSGVFKHVVLHARLQQAYADARTTNVRQEVRRAGFSRDLIAANIAGLHRLVSSLEWHPGESAWSNYRGDNTYTDRDTRLKSQVVADVCQARMPAVVWDLGANDGHYSRIAAGSASVVLAIDSDPVPVERLYRSLRVEGDTRIVPLVADLADPSPSLGWRGRERPNLLSRAKPDVVLALAVVHHLAITRNVPVSEIMAWLADFGADVVLEVPHREDPQVHRLLANKREDLHQVYNVRAFETSAQNHFTVRSATRLPSGTRTIFHLSPA